MAFPYLPRLIRDRVLASLADTPVVCLLGPRQVGKTTLARRIDPERAYLNLDDSTLLEAARQDPLGFIEGLPERVMLDEVQRAPELLLAIKSVVDRDRQPGRFLLTGSANLLLLPKAQDSLAGRMEVIYLWGEEPGKVISSEETLQTLAGQAPGPGLLMAPGCSSKTVACDPFWRLHSSACTGGYATVSSPA